jgi:hypothetical protein
MTNQSAGHPRRFGDRELGDMVLYSRYVIGFGLSEAGRVMVTISSPRMTVDAFGWRGPSRRWGWHERRAPLLLPGREWLRPRAVWD